MQKAVLIKQPGQSFWWLHTLSRSLSAPALALQQGGWITVYKRQFFLVSAIYITWPVFTWVCFVTTWGSGLDCYRILKYTLLFVFQCLLLISSRNNRWLYTVFQVSKLLCSKVLSTIRFGLGPSTVQLVDKADCSACWNLSSVWTTKHTYMYMYINMYMYVCCTCMCV